MRATGGSRILQPTTTRPQGPAMYSSAIYKQMIDSRTADVSRAASNHSAITRPSSLSHRRWRPRPLRLAAATRFAH
jgi:hypothetical protein